MPQLSIALRKHQLDSRHYMVAAFLCNALLRESARTWPFMHDPVCDVAVACRLCPKSSVTCQSLLASKNAQITRAFIGLAFFQGNRSAVYICCICGSTTACQCLKNSYMHAFCSWANLSAILGLETQNQHRNVQARLLSNFLHCPSFFGRREIGGPDSL